MNVQRSRSTATMVLATAIVGAILAWTALAQGDATVSAQQIERGEVIYQETAGGVGCAYCHGVGGMGDGTSGVGAPVIAGALASAIRESLAGAVPMMGFIKLTPSELEDVAAYVAYLGTVSGSEPPPPEPEATDPFADGATAGTAGRSEP